MGVVLMHTTVSFMLYIRSLKTIFLSSVKHHNKDITIYNVYKILSTIIFPDNIVKFRKSILVYVGISHNSKHNSWSLSAGYPHRYHYTE